MVKTNPIYVHVVYKRFFIWPGLGLTDYQIALNPLNAALCAVETTSLQL